MKANLHPKDYQLVVFEDLNTGQKILTRSTAKSSETTTWNDGNTYPLIKVHVSSFSHPFYTHEQKVLDIEGRVDRFKARAEIAKKSLELRQKSASKQAKRQANKALKSTAKAPSLTKS